MLPPLAQAAGVPQGVFDLNNVLGVAVGSSKTAHPSSLSMLHSNTITQLVQLPTMLQLSGTVLMSLFFNASLPCHCTALLLPCLAAPASMVALSLCRATTVEDGHRYRVIYAVVKRNILVFKWYTV